MQHYYSKLPTEPPDDGPVATSSGHYAPGDTARTGYTFQSESGADGTPWSVNAQLFKKSSSKGLNLVTPRMKNPSEKTAATLLEARAQKHAQKMKAESVHWSRHTGTVNPASPVFGIWNPVMIIVIFVDALIQPFLVTFQSFLQDRAVYFIAMSLNTIIWFMYCLDTLLQLVTQVPKPDGSGWLIAVPTVVFAYATSVECRYDFITVIPWGWINCWFQPEVKSRHLVIGEESRGLAWCLLDSMRLLRLLRLHSIKRLTFRYRHQFHISFATHTLVSCVTYLFLTLHVIACLWAMVGIESPFGSETWIQHYWRSTGDENIGNFRPKPANVYLAAFYWALATTTSIGYGDVVPAPVSALEQLASITLMCIAALAWAIVLANAVDLVKDLHQSSEDYQKTMDQVEKVFSSDTLDPALRVSVREYFEKVYDLDLQDNTQQLIARMSPMLQRMIVQSLYKDWIEDVPWIEKMSGPCLVQVVLKMENFLYIPGEVIPDIRMTSFVQLGTLFLGGRTLRKGDSWGIDMTLEGYMRRREAGFAMNFVSTLGLTFRCLTDVLEDFPEDAWMVKRVSCWMALKRHASAIATDTKQRKAKVKKSVLQKAMEMTGDPHKDAEYVQLGDDARYTVKAMRQNFEECKENFELIKDTQINLEAGQEQSKQRDEALQSSMKSNTDSIRSIEQRLDGLERNMSQLLAVFQDGKPVSPISTTKGRFSPWTRSSQQAQ